MGGFLGNSRTDEEHEEQREKTRERERERLRENVKWPKETNANRREGERRAHAHTRATDTDPQFPDRATKVAMKTTRATKVAKGIVDTCV